MTRLERYELITEVATEVGSDWSNVEVAKFHYFNPFGLAARKRELNREVADAVSSGRVNSGALIAFGSFNDSATNAMYKHASKKKLSSHKLYTAIVMLEKDIFAAEQFLKTLDMEAAA